MDRFDRKTVLVTGAAGALGSNLVRRFVGEGARVIVGARREEQVKDLLEELGDDRVRFAQLDVTDEEQWAAAVRTAQDAFGPVSVLVNNAAQIILGTTESLAREEFRQVLDTNLVGVFLGIRAVVPSMRRAGGGTIVNVNSITGLAAAPGLAAYAASKWGIRGLTLTAAKELAPDGIRVNGVHPGIIETPLAYDPDTGAEILPVGDFAIPRRASVDEISNFILFAASEDSAFATGTELVADGGFLLGSLR